MYNCKIPDGLSLPEDTKSGDRVKFLTEWMVDTDNQSMKPVTVDGKPIMHGSEHDDDEDASVGNMAAKMYQQRLDEE